MRFRSSTALALLVLTGCFEGPSCNLSLDDCENDFDCGSNEICVRDGSTATCESRLLCSPAQGCPDGHYCDQRPGLPADTPFESETPGKQVCECAGTCNSGEGGGAGWGGYGGGGGYGGAGGSGGSSLCELPPPTGDIAQALQLGGPDSDGGPIFAEGGAVFALPFRGTLAGDGAPSSAGDADVLVLGYDTLDEIAWWRPLGNESANVPTALARWNDLVVVATSFDGTIDVGTGPIESGAGGASLIVGLGPGGATLWAHTLRSDGDITVSGLAFDSADGRLLVAGTFSGLLEIGGTTLKSDGGTDGFVAALGLTTLAMQWSHVLGGAGDQHVAAITADIYGNTYLAGGFEGELSVDGSTPAGADAMDAFVMRVADDGFLSWTRVIGGPDRQVATAVALSPSGLVVAGARGSMTPSPGYVDFGDGTVLPGVGLVDGYAASFGMDGSISWGKLFSGLADTGEITPRALAVDCNGHITIAGSATDGATFGAEPLAGYGGHDAFVHKMDSKGEALWTRLFGGPEEDGVTGLAIDEGVIQVGGSFTGGAAFGELGLQSAGAEDTFVLEVTP